MSPCEHGPKRMVNRCPDCEDALIASYEKKIKALRTKNHHQRMAYKKLLAVTEMFGKVQMP